MIFEPIDGSTVVGIVNKDGVLIELPGGVFNGSIQSGGNAKVVELTNTGDHAVFVVASNNGKTSAQVPGPGKKGHYPVPPNSSRTIKVPSNSAFIHAISVQGQNVLFLTPGSWAN